MTVHERIESLTDVYVAGGLRADERRDVDAHLQDCAACAARLRDAREFATWAKGLIANDAPPADLEDRLIERFRAAGQSKKRRLIVGKRTLKITGWIAAAVALVFIGNLFDTPRGLKHVASAEAGFRANDRGATSVNEFWAADVPGLYSKDSLASSSFGFGGVQADGLGLQSRPDSLNQVLARQEGRNRGLSRDGTEKLAELEDLAAVKVRETFAEAQQREGLERSVTGLAAGGAVDELRRQKGWNIEAEKRNVTGREPKGPRAGAVYFVEQGEAPKAAVQDNRKIIRSADVAVEVESYDATYAKLSELATAEKGHVASANTQKLANGKIQATVVLRIPPDRFEAVVAKLKDFGTIRHQNLGSDDVTKAYVDLESRLASKQILAQRLAKLLAEGKGTVKELMEVEVQMGATNEAIEQIKGEIKYYDNRIGLSTLTLQIAEKDLGQPFEYVQTLAANLALTVRDPDDAYAKAQKEIVDAGGQVVDSRMNRQSDGTSVGTIRGRVDADKFQALRDALKKLGVATNDTVNQQKTARGGREGTPKIDAPLRKEQAVLDLTLSSPPLFVTRRSQLQVETPEVESAYQNSRRAAEAGGGKITDGSLQGRSDRMAATLKIQIDADKFAALVEALKSAGKVKNAAVASVLPATAADGGAALLRERAEIDLTLVSPPQLIAEENGLVRTIRDTFANSWAGLLWSVEKLFVGLSLAGPWALLLAAAVLVWRRRRKKAAAP